MYAFDSRIGIVEALNLNTSILRSNMANFVSVEIGKFYFRPFFYLSFYSSLFFLVEANT
jgi:hypothetical protein